MTRDARSPASGARSKAGRRAACRRCDVVTHSGCFRRTHSDGRLPCANRLSSSASLRPVASCCMCPRPSRPHVVPRSARHPSVTPLRRPPTLLMMALPGLTRTAEEAYWASHRSHGPSRRCVTIYALRYVPTLRWGYSHTITTPLRYRALLIAPTPPTPS